MIEEDGKIIANAEDRYAALLAAVRPGVITDDAELERLTEEVNRLVTKGIRENQLRPEEEKLLVLLTRLIEDYEQQQESLNDTVLEAACMSCYWQRALSARGDGFHTQIRHERRRHAHRAIGLLIVLQDRQPRAPHRQPRSVQRVNKLGLRLAVAFEANLRAARLERLAIRAGRNLAVGLLAR